MSKNLLILTRILLKNGSNSKGKQKKKRSQWTLLAILAVAFAPLVYQIAYFTWIMFDALSQIGQQGIILSLGVTASSFVIFFFGIFYVLNTFFFSNDIESLLPLPVRPYEILGSKFIVVAVYEYLTELIVLLPMLIVFGIKSYAGPVYYIYSAAIFLVLPVIPLVVASVIVMPIMRFTNIAKSKDRFRFVGGIIAIFFAVGINGVIQRFSTRAMDVKQWQDTGNSMMRITTKAFPSSRFAAEGLVNSTNIQGIVNVLLFFAISAVAFALFLFLGELLYFKGVMGISEVSARRKSISSEELSRRTESSPVIKSYILRELKSLFRSPVYFMNCILMNFLWPVFLLIPMLTQSNGMGNLSKVAELLNKGDFSGLILTVGFAMVMFISSSNGITATSISREGQQLFVNKYIPVSYKKQIMAKVLSGVLISIIGMLTTILVATLLFKVRISLAVLIILVGFPAIFFSSLTGILMDLYHPKLNWDNEQKAVKQNLNFMFNMMLGVAFAIVTVFVIYMLKLTLLEALLGILLVYGGLDGLLYFMVVKMGVKRFSTLEI